MEESASVRAIDELEIKGHFMHCSNTSRTWPFPGDDLLLGKPGLKPAEQLPEKLIA